MIILSTLYILCGIPGCGKTTWAKKFHYQAIETVYVSRDDIRFSLTTNEENYFAKEKETFNMFVDKIISWLANGYNVIADATHISPQSRKKLTRAIDMGIKNYEIIYVVFDTPIIKCLENNKKREGKNRVPDVVIYNMNKNFSMPVYNEDERISEIWTIRSKNNE